MKALITAGGRATRLRPITTTINKHLIPLGGRPMLWQAISKVAECGIKEIAVNVNVGETEIQKACGDGSRWGVKLTYLEQQGGPKGLAHIIKNARPFLGDEPFVFYLGDNIILGSIRGFVEKFRSSGVNGLLALAKVHDPQRFGVPVIVDGRIVRVEEKPARPQSDFAVTGIYVYDKSVHQAVDAIQPSARGEYEISDVHTWLIEHGFAVGYEEITGWWKDTGKPEDLVEGNQLILDEMTDKEAQIEGEVAPEARIIGRVKLGAGSRVLGRSVIEGPANIGSNCIITDSRLGPHVSIGDGSRISGADIRHSVLFDGVTVNTQHPIADSLIGREVTLKPAASEEKAVRLVVGDCSVVEVGG